MFTSEELETARSTLEALQNPLVLKVNLTRDNLSKKFRTLVDQLVSLSDKLQAVYLTYTEDGPPNIEIKPNLRYMALPNGKEMAPFLQTLIFRSKGETSLGARTLRALEKFISPARVEVMVSLMCPHCPVVVSLVNQLALASSYLEVNIIDITLFSDHAQKYGIQAVPTVVIDERDQLVGNISESVLVDRLTDQAPSAFHPESFKKIIKEGDADKLAGMMVADEEIYSGALKLLSDPDWSVRMGMMVVLEEVAERSPDLVQRTYPYLLDMLDHEDDNQRGDTAYLLGLIGDASVLGFLEKLLDDANGEVAEAASEAIQRIREREALVTS
jgi:hypothetical protein